jgi:hypothetical protein
MNKEFISSKLQLLEKEIKTDSNNFFIENIPISKIKSAKESHQLEAFESILYLRDFTFFGSASESCIITINGISVVTDDTKPPLFISWNQIENVEYIDDSYIFYFDNDKKTDYLKINREHISHNSDENNFFGGNFAKTFNEISNEFENFEKKFYDELLDLASNKKEEEFIEKSKLFLQEYGEQSKFYYKVLFLRANTFYLLDKLENALSITKNVLEKNDDKYYFHVLQGKIFKKNKEYNNSLISLQKAQILNSKLSINDNIDLLINESYSSLIDTFFNQEYSNRKIILVTNGLQKFVSSFITLDKNSLPNNIHFPIGHPIENELYICHPCKDNLYIPIKNHELDLFLDRINEFCYLLQSLGAVELTIKTIKGKSTESLSSNNLNIDSKVSVNNYGNLESNVSSSNENSNTNNLSRKLEKTQRFSPKLKPYLPSELAWYNREPSWQRLFQQRTNGNILEYHETLSTTQQKILSENEVNTLNLDLKHALANLNLNIIQNSSNSINDQENTEWEINVKFESIENLNEILLNTNSSEKISISNLTLIEQDYLELCNVINEDSIISEDESNLLKRKQIKLGINDQRAHELFEFSKNKRKFSNEEIEYIEEINFCLDSNNEISDDERRILNKLKVNLGISDDRAQDLENYTYKIRSI